MTAEYWLKQSILSYFTHRRAENLLRCMLDEMGVTPQEVDFLARKETVQLFRENICFHRKYLTQFLEFGVVFSVIPDNYLPGARRCTTCITSC